MGQGGSTEPKSQLQQIYDTEGEDAYVKALWDDVIKKEDYDSLKGINFNYDCLAFEGGGVKGTAYVGAVKVLEDLGALKKVKRFAGTSAGAYMAMQLAIGMPVDTVFKRNGIPNLQQTFYDSGSWSLPYNILMSYGWHSGNKLLRKIEDDLEEFLGDKNATFLDLYKKRRIELCVVVTDLNGRNPEYCHPKTTPAIKISEAVRTSMSLPFLFAPTAIKERDMDRYYCDGALLENYPIRVFDGWYLSMDKGDNFFERIGEDPNTKFDGFNPKMLGMAVFSHGENQSNSDAFFRRYGDKLLEGRPDSKLSRERDYTREVLKRDKDEKRQVENSVKELAKQIVFLARDQADEYGTISYETFMQIMHKLKTDKTMSRHLELVVGPDGLEPLAETFQEMDYDSNNRLSMIECLTHLQKKGVQIRYNLEARRAQKIESVAAYITSIIDVMQCYIVDNQTKPEDRDRTIGIYTDYVTVTDFDMSLDDKAYLLRQGYKAAISFLKIKK